MPEPTHGQAQFGGLMRIGGVVHVMPAGGRAGALPGAAASEPALRVVSPELAAIPGIEELACVVGTPQAALTDAEKGVIRRVVGPIVERPLVGRPRMPHDGTADRLLGLAKDGIDGPGTMVHGDAARQHVLDTWAARMSINERHDVSNADELIDLLDQGPVVSFDDPATRARAQVLAHLARDSRIGAPELHFTGGYEISLMFGPDLGDHGRSFAQEAAILMVPARRAAFDEAVERAVAGIEPGAGSPFPQGTTIEMIVSDATGWNVRSREERMRLLDAFTAPSHAPNGPFAQRRSLMSTPSQFIHTELADHLALQLDRARDGSSQVPTGMSAYDVFTSTDWGRRPAAERRAILDLVAEAWGVPVIERLRAGETTSLDRLLGDGDLAHLRAQGWKQVHEFLDGSRDELPASVRASDVIASDMPAIELDPVLRALAARFGAETPEGATAWLVSVRDPLEAAAGSSAQPDQVRAVAKRAIELVDRNLARIQRTGPRIYSDGYAGWPDLAEVGRVRATVVLLEQLDRHPAAARGEVLTW